MDEPSAFQVNERINIKPIVGESEGGEVHNSAERHNTMLMNQVASPEPVIQNGMVSPHGNTDSLDHLYN